MLLVVITGVLIIVCGVVSYQTSRDAVAPMVIFTPLLLYIYAYLPYQMLAGDQWSQFPLLQHELTSVYVVNLVNVAAFCFAALPRRRMKSVAQSRLMQPLLLNPRLRRNLFNSGAVLAFLAVTGFSVMLWKSGGPARVFAHGKPFLSSGSGYLGELPNLAFPAMILFAFAWQGKRLTIPRILIMLLAASPHLLMASLGGRRGPAFLVIVTLAGCYALIRRKTFRLSTVMGGLVMLGVLMLFLLTQRKNIYVGSEWDFSLSDTVDALLVRETSEGHEAVVSAAGIVAAQKTDRYFWGKRYFVVLFVRPIPRQLWEDKYDDVGMGWMKRAPGSAGFSDIEWLSTVGFVPFKGNAGGFITDMYVEFYWFGVIVVGLIGALYRRVWLNAREKGRFWPLLYFMMLALSVYLPSQSVQAWLVRLLILAIPAFIVWRLFIRQGSTIVRRR